MILYHFTALKLLPAILRDGLSRGDVPLAPTAGEQAVWFTTDGDGSGHGLSDARPMTDQEAAVARALAGVSPASTQAPAFLDKRRVRIRVVIPSRDRKLIAWMPFARKRLERSWMDILHKVAGGAAKAETWWLYRGVVSPTEFTEVLIRREDGSYTPVTAADHEEAEAAMV